MRKFSKVFGFLLVPIAYLLVPPTAYAVCPVCTVAVVSGLGLSRWLGIDDSISGVWAGGLMISLTFWTVEWLGKKSFSWLKKVSNNLRYLSIFLFWILFTYLPLWLGGIIGHPFNRIFGVDKLLFGSIVGISAFFLGVWLDKKEREVAGKILFNFQRVIFPVSALVIVSLVMYFLTR
jgi:hypothetical protein